MTVNFFSENPLLSAIIVVGIFLLITQIIFFVLIRNKITDNNEKLAIFKDELHILFKSSENEYSQKLFESRKEFRELNSENRREIHEIFQNLQSGILKTISSSHSSQNEQLNIFRNLLNQLSEKLINNLNSFNKTVSESFYSSSKSLNEKQDEFKESTINKLGLFEKEIINNDKENRKELTESLNSFGLKFSESTRELNFQINSKFNEFNEQQINSNKQAKESIIEVRDAIEKQLKLIRDDNTQQLAEMRKTVDEKLQSTLEKRLGESFKQVSDRLEQVHKGLGEMQSLAIGVGDLKKVLTNVKTRGILGEYQLGNILEQILSPEQYSINVSTKRGSQAHVEFAVKLPGKTDEKTVWLPMDSKFPLESYQILLSAYEEGDSVKVDQSQKILLRSIENFAKDISSKYIDPPHTTDFAIMFLPIEGLFAEVLRHPQVFELLQRKYRITITGPTTLSALLNSLHMGFRTLAVQKRSSEVWKVLAEVKTEFSNYSEQLSLVYKQLTTASNSLEKLKDTRTKAMERKLRGVTALDVDYPQENLIALEL